MGTTPAYGLRYPEPTDFVTDGALAIRNLAEDVDADLGAEVTRANAAYEVTLHRIGADQFVVGGGAPTLTTVGLFPLWRLDAAAEESVTAFIDIPEHWATYHIDLLWANSGAGAGDVSWRVDNGNVEPGGSITSGNLNTAVTATAGAVDVLMSTRLKSNQGAPTAGASSGVGALRIVRQAADAADTLPNDASIVGLRLTKAS